jgi:hypothetical protein
MDDPQPPKPEYMSKWRWEDQGWRDRVGQDPTKIVLEALRRAVDIRDQGVGSRSVLLVDVLNELCLVLGIDGGRLWDLSDE